MDASVTGRSASGVVELIATLVMLDLRRLVTVTAGSAEALTGAVPLRVLLSSSVSLVKLKASAAWIAVIALATRATSVAFETLTGIFSVALSAITAIVVFDALIASSMAAVSLRAVPLAAAEALRARSGISVTFSTGSAASVTLTFGSLAGGIPI
jgi:hypothetical protein